MVDEPKNPIRVPDYKRLHHFEPPTAYTITKPRLWQSLRVPLVLRRDEHYKLIQIQQRKNQTALQAVLMWEKELDILFESLYEDKDFGKLTEVSNMP